MKTVKRIFYTIFILLLAGCGVVLVYALNPSLTQKLEKRLYSVQTDAENSDNAGEGADSTDGNAPGNSLSGNVNTDNTDGLNHMVIGNMYVLPSENPGSSENIPENLSDKSGYEPVKEEGLEVPDEQADIISGSLEPGETGEGLSFDTRMYPYYGMLQDNMKKLYCQIYANALKCNTSFAPIVPVNVKQLKNVFEAVYNDHPELFWLETQYSCKYLQNGQCVEIVLCYHRTAAELEEAKKRFDAQAEGILKEAQKLEDAAAQEKYVHDALVKYTSYEGGAAMNQSAYSAIVNGQAVCAGYARAFQYLMQQLSHPCYYCTGISNQNHAWNILLLGNEYVNVDVTWDDTNPSTYDYYNKTDVEFAPTHVRKGLSLYLPACGNAGFTGNGEILVESEADALINPNPQKPIEWVDTWDKDNDEDKEASDKENLAEAGVTEEEVMRTLEDYYADCLEQITHAGAGLQQFSNVVPQSLWETIERVYSDGSFKKGYVDSALKELGMDEFAIQLQYQRLGGGFCRLYHNISIWNIE